MKKEYEVVISGMSGSFPECKSMYEFEDKLYTNENLVKEHRSEFHDGLSRMGKVNDPLRFDNVFFGVHKKLATVMDIHTKHSFEKTYEAIIDAGMNPQELYGSNTAVMMSSFLSETEGANMLVMKQFAYVLLGHARCMQSNRVSYAFNFKGPSFTMIGTWEGSVSCFELAHILIKKGYAKAAIIGTTNFSFYTQVDNHFRDLGRLNEDGKTKSFSADADGYNRSEGITVFFLQRAEDARRSYGSVVKVLSRAQMDNREELTFPCNFDRFLADFYSDAPCKPSEIGYVEGDGSATPIRDAMELNAMAQIICPGRTKPLPVTSIKSKIGHCESAAPFFSLISALIAFKTGYIPPVLHYTAPNPLVPALKNGSIKIVTERTKLEGDYVGITAMGFCNTFAHMLIKRNPKSKAIKQRKEDEGKLPWIFIFSGRNENDMKEIMQEVEKADNDEEYFGLLYNVFKTDIPRHQLRGYLIKGQEETKSNVIPQLEGSTRQLWYIFSGMGSQWLEMGTGIMEIPIIRDSLLKSHKFLMESKQVDLLNIITSQDKSVYDDILNCFLGIAAIQVALTDLLEELGVKPDGMIGHSVGEQGCGYADKCLTSEQVLLAAYARGRASNEAKLIRGMMAAIGKGYNAIKDELPEGIEVACHNSDISCTLSGPTELMESYVEKLKSQGVFARLVNVANTAYHSKYITPAGPFFLKYLKEVIPEPKLRSSKWISSSVTEDKWDTDLAKHSSAEYYTNNLLSYVLFEEAATKIPKDAICVEIAPHGLLQAIVKRSLPNCVHIPLTNRGKPGSLFTLEALALMYSNGVQLDFSKLYPKVDFPVSRETGYLNNILTWDHNYKWPLLTEEKNREVMLRKESHVFLELFRHPDEPMVLAGSHRVGGTTEIPVSNMLCMILEALTDKIEDAVSFNIYEMNNVKIHDTVTLQTRLDDKLRILYQKGNGKFEVILYSTMAPLITGVIHPIFTPSLSEENEMRIRIEKTQLLAEISSENVYKYFQNEDCLFNDDYKNIVDIKIFSKGYVGRVRWTCNAQYYLDAILKLIIFHSSLENDCLMEIESIGQLRYNTSEFSDYDKDVLIYYDANQKCIKGEGIGIKWIKTRPAAKIRQSARSPNVMKYVFAPYSQSKSQNEFVEECIQTVIEASGKQTINIIGNKSSQLFQSVLGNDYFKNCLQRKGNLRVKDFKDVVMKAYMDPSDTSDTIFIISEGKLMVPFVNLIETTKLQCYLLQSATSPTELTTFQKISPIFKQHLEKTELIFYKKQINPLTEGDYIQLPEKCLLNPKDHANNFNEKKSTFIIHFYETLFDIINVLTTSSDLYSLKHTRFVFVDSKTAHFNLTSDFCQKQFAKDLKVNVCQVGVWGSFVERNVEIPFRWRHELLECHLPLKSIRCDSVNLKVLGLNLDTFVVPSSNPRLGIMEYVGINKQTKETVMGLGQLSPDNRLIADPILVWRKPEGWSVDQAASAPLFYAMAYYLLNIKCKYATRTITKVLVHGAHTAFSQALIHLALDHGMQIFTTCFTNKQKKAILKQFPQIDKSDIYALNEETSVSFYDGVMMSTKGKGVRFIIDSLNNNQLITLSINCVGNFGKYILVCHDNKQSDYTFGMRVFNKCVVTSGFNPDFLFDMVEEEKRQIVRMVDEGLKKGIVVPLACHHIDGALTQRAAVESLKSWYYNEENLKKVLVNVDQTDSQNGPLSSRATSNKTALIIGDYNIIWLDLTKWLISWGAHNIYLLIDKSNIPVHVLLRLNQLVCKYGAININFIDFNSLSSKENFEKTLQRITDVQTFDKAFYVMPGMESKFEIIDSALRRLCPKCVLVGIEKESTDCKTERRTKDGFSGICFILKKESVKKDTLLNVVDNWMRQPDPNKTRIVVVDEVVETKELEADINEPNIFPKTIEDLIELSRDTVKVPTMKETSTSGLITKEAKELNPVFVFPGLKLRKFKKLISQLNYPAHIAQYPAKIESIDKLASQLSKEIVKNSKLRIFTLIAEGWSGLLALTVAKYLEHAGKSAEVILIDAAPSMVKQWSKQVAHSVIKCCLPNYHEGEVKVLDDLKKGKSKINHLFDQEMRNDFNANEVMSGMDILINRLEAVTNYKDEHPNTFLTGKVHIATTRNSLLDNHRICLDLNEISNKPCSFIVLEDAISDTILDSTQLKRDISNLILQERNGGVYNLSVANIGTLDIKDLRLSAVSY